MKFTKIAALALAGVMTVSVMTGCGMNKNAAAATMKDGVEVKLGTANFMCMYQQATQDEMLRQYGGDNVWNSDSYGTGSTMLDTTRDGVMDDLHDMYVMKAHMGEYDVEITDEDKAKITQAAKDFIAANDNSTLKELGADQETVEEVLTLYTIKSKFHKVFMDKTEVTDKEANMRAYSMVSIAYTKKTDADGNSVDMTADEAKAAKTTAEKIAKEMKKKDKKGKKKTLSDVASANGQSATTGTYASDDTTLDTKVKEALDKLKEGETTELITTDTDYVIATLDQETDKEATETNKKSVKEKKYQDKLDEWKKDDGWTVDQDQINKIKFENKFKTTDNSSEKEEDTATEETAESTEKTTGTKEKTTESTEKKATEKKATEKK